MSPAPLPREGPRVPVSAPGWIRGTEWGFRRPFLWGKAGRLPAPLSPPLTSMTTSPNPSLRVAYTVTHTAVHACICVCIHTCWSRRVRGATGVYVFSRCQRPCYTSVSLPVGEGAGRKAPAGPPSTLLGPELTWQAAARGHVLPPGGRNVHGTAPHGRLILRLPAAMATVADKHPPLCWPQWVYLPTGFLLFLGRLCARTL